MKTRTLFKIFLVERSFKKEYARAFKRGRERDDDDSDDDDESILLLLLVVVAPLLFYVFVSFKIEKKYYDE